MNKTVYIIEFLRYGEREAHSYIGGVFSDRKLAEYEAQLHMIMRAGKYTAEIHEEAIDGYSRNGVVTVIEEVEDEEYLQNSILSRKDWLKYRKQLIKKFNESK